MTYYPQAKLNTSYYSVIAGFYNILLWLFGYKWAVHHFIRLLPFERNQHFAVLDAGAGTGLYSFAVLDRFPNAHITAFDLNKDMLSQMKKAVERKGLQNRVTLFVGDVTKLLPVAEKKYDLIMVSGVFEYLRHIEEAVKNLSRYLKRGGYFLHAPVKEDWIGKVASVIFRFILHSRESNISAFTKEGYMLEKSATLPFLKEAHLFKKYEAEGIRVEK